jgi:hypothetical protein
MLSIGCALLLARHWSMNDGGGRLKLEISTLEVSAIVYNLSCYVIVMPFSVFYKV